jgi:hypothetical protein
MPSQPPRLDCHNPGPGHSGHVQENLISHAPRARFYEFFGANRPNRRFEFHERGQLFICVHNETLSIIAMRIYNEDCFLSTIQDRLESKTIRGV